MRKVIFAINMSMDGYFGHEDIVPAGELHEYFTELLKDAGVILFGRKMYQVMFPYWHTIAENQTETPASNEFARMIDSIPKIVFSKTLNEVVSENTSISRADIEVELQELRNEPGGDIYIDGLSVAAHLMRLGMIDEYYFVVHPVLAGKGTRLFEGDMLKEPIPLELVDSRKLDFGAIAHHYRKR